MNVLFARLKRVLLLKWYSFILVFSSILYGYQIIDQPEIVEQYRVYQAISTVTSPWMLGLIFIGLGCIKLVGIATDNLVMKRYSVVALACVWSIFCVSFLFSSLANTVWIYSLSMTMLAIGIAMREV